MQNTKLLQVLATLSVEELEEFHVHVKQLPVRDAIKKLLAHLSEFRGNWNQVDLELEVIGTHLGYEPPFKSLSNRASDLYKILMEFLVHRKIYSPAYSFEKEFLELKIFEERGIDKLKKLKRERLMRQLDQSKITDQWSAFRRMLLYETAYYNWDSNKIDLKKTEIEACLKFLQVFSINTKLKFACEILSRSQVLNISTSDYLHTFGEILLLRVDPKDPYQALFHSTFKTLYYLRKEDFDTTLNLLKEKEENLTAVDSYKVFLYLVNVLVQYPKKQIESFGSQLLDIYKFGVPRGFLTHQKQMSRVTFVNIIETACQMHDIVYAETFYTKYSSKISSENVENTLALSRAIIHFHKQNFETVVTCLNIINFKALDEKFRANILLLCSFYEIYADAEITQDKAKSFEIFVKRKYPILGHEFLVSVRNFISFVLKLLQRTQSASAIEKELKEIAPIVMRQWLRKKLQTYKPI